MSLTKEQAQKYHDKAAIVCCRTEKGTVLTAAELEDPTLFPEMVETGIITLPDNVLTIGEVIGATLVQTIEGLTPLTRDLLSNVSAKQEAKPVKQQPVSGGVFRFSGEGLQKFELELPLNVAGGSLISAGTERAVEEKVVAELERRTYKINKVVIGNKTSIDGDVLTIRKTLTKEAKETETLVKELTMEVINPQERDRYVDSIMDIIPVATKASGIIGEGITNLLDGVVFMLTGVDEAGVQIHEFGSSEGKLNEQISWGKPGSPDHDDIIVNVHVVVQKNTGMERRGPYASHRATDLIIQEIRNVMKSLPVEKAVKVEKLDEIRRFGKPKVVLVKEIMGQGAMHDNVMLPNEPCGVYGGRQNVDLGNVPIVESVSEVRDGGIHALACIGPATKEVTRHFYREPLVEALAEDAEFDFCGVIFIGSPQVNDEKAFVSKRLGSLVKSMDVDGAIVTTEGFGNNHIDFSDNINEIAKNGVPVVGVSFCAYQGQLVVGNQYMNAMIELNKSAEGIESEVMAENTITEADAARAIQMLKNKMAGVEILPPDAKWNQEVINDNQKIVDGK